jgi:UDPglucose 6-dehydrogenase
VDRLVEAMGEDLRGRHIAVWGLSFKPNTDDMREAPSRSIVRRLLQLGATVSAFDPIAREEGLMALALDMAEQPELLRNFRLANSEMQALGGADALLVVTEWKNFHNPDFEVMKAAMRVPYVIDGRNLYNPEALQELGIAYQGIGRRNALVKSIARVARQAATAAPQPLNAELSVV